MATSLPDALTLAPEQSRQSQLACAPLFVAGLLLCWFGLAPLLIAGLAALFLAPLPSLLAGLLGLILLAGLLAIPLLGALWLARRPGWGSFYVLSLSLLLVAGYALVAVVVRAVAGVDSGLEAALGLAGLTLVAVAGGVAATRASGVPFRLVLDTLGLRSPPLAGLGLAAALLGLLTLGWPLTGALGDSWASLGLLFQTLAVTLPEEILFRGAVLGVLIYSFPKRRTLATTLSLLIYLVYLPTLVLPGDNWESLALVFVLIPLALLTTQLRALTGSIWAGVLVAWFYRAVPQLFTDPRDQILEPAQWLAGGWMLMAAVLVAVLIWIGRRTLTPGWRLSRIATLLLTTLMALVLWAGWLGAWVFAGELGFYNDGFIIVMQDQADLSAAYDIADPVARRAYVYEELVRTAEETQAPLRAELQERGLTYKPYYLINMIRVDGHHRLQEQFAGLPGVADVLYNPNVRPYPAHTALGTLPAPEGNGVEWNIRRTGAPDVWDMGYRGQGVVVGGQDTGYDWEHPALQPSYRGWDVATGEADHDYNWHDAWDDTPAPHDDGDHGTHTMGTIVGDDGKGNQIGMAPESQWIGCRNMRRGIGNPPSYTQCMEFLLAPFPLGGDPFRGGDVTRSPDVVNNSWACPDEEGCEDDTLEPAIDALRAAGIMMVTSAGNEGPACETVLEPPARYPAAVSVGAVDSSGQVTFFSSRGPVPDAGQESFLSPDVVAPGSQVRSSVSGSSYGLADGTSMAGPHVTGLVALLWSARPDLRGDLDATEQIIHQSAASAQVFAACTPDDGSSDRGGYFTQIFAAFNSGICACGEVTGTPNNVYGWGEINALRAVEMALER